VGTKKRVGLFKLFNNKFSNNGPWELNPVKNKIKTPKIYSIVGFTRA